MKLSNLALATWAYGSLILVMAILIAACSYIVYHGGPLITVDFLCLYPAGMPLGVEGGIFPAIIGSILEGLLTASMAAIISVPCALYMVYGNISRWKSECFLFTLRCMSGLPSVLIGLFGYSVLILYLGIDKSLLSASITLTVMVIPFITLRLVKVFHEFPRETYEAALNMGLSPSYIWMHMVIPSAMRDGLSAITLGAAYAMGATAPIMYTGAVLYTRSIPNITDPFMALPYHLYILVNEGYSVDLAYATAFVLMVILLCINIICRWIGGRS